MEPDSYIDGFVLAVPTANKETFRQHASEAAQIFKKHGALEIVECWGDDVPEGKLTSMPLAVQRKDDPLCPKDMPFDGQRVIYGGFRVLVHA